MSIEYDPLFPYAEDNRDRYQYHIDADGRSHSGCDLKSGCGGGTLQEGLESLLSFLSAAAESYRYKGMEGENSDLFPEWVDEWAAQHSDEIGMMRLELEENKDLIED